MRRAISIPAAFWVLLACECVAAQPAQAQNAEVARAISAYRSRLASAEQRGGARIEEAFTGIESLRHTLMETNAAGDTRLEQMSTETYRSVATQLRGVAINRDEGVFVWPEIDFWTSLASSRGGAADRAFFAAWEQTFGDGLWPSYAWQQTDYSACTAFGHNALVDDYGMWTTYRRRFPGRYSSAVRERIDAVEDEIEHSTCACEGPDGVRREFEIYLRRFPSATNRSVVKQRLDSVKSGRSGIRFDCHSG